MKSPTPVFLAAFCAALGMATIDPSYAGPVRYSGKASKAVIPPIQSSPEFSSISFSTVELPLRKNPYRGIFQSDPLRVLTFHQDPSLIVRVQDDPANRRSTMMRTSGVSREPFTPEEFPSRFALTFDEVAMRPGLVALWPVFIKQQGGLWFESLDEVEDDVIPYFSPPRIWIGQDAGASEKDLLISFTFQSFIQGLVSPNGQD